MIPILYIYLKNILRINPYLLIVTLVSAFILSVTFISAVGPTTVGLGTASSFAVLAGAGITNTGPTTITGDVGTFPTTTETGFGSIILSGTNHMGDAVTQGAKDDLVTAYNDAAGRTPVITIPTELGGSTLNPGVYDSSDGAFGITGTLTLDGQGDPGAVFIFKMASTLVTASSSNVVLIGGAQSCNIFWQVGSSTTLGTSSILRGTVLALTSITATTGATVDGRLLARNGAVTLDTNTITRSVCAAPVATPTATPSALGAATPSALGAATPILPNTGSSEPVGPPILLAILAGIAAYLIIRKSPLSRQSVAPRN